MTYLQLFLSFLQIGALSFGGGYAAMPLIQEQIVTRHGWLSMGATFVGTRVAGIPGAMAATVGCILPACILVTLIARLYLKYRDLAVLQGVLGSLRPAVVAMIASAGILILLNAFWGGAGVTLAGTNWVMAAIFAGCFALLRGTKLSPIAVMLLGGAVNLLVSILPFSK